MTMSNLIIWDKETEIYLKDFKENDDKVITGLSDFNEYDFNKCEGIKSIIILLELNWKNVNSRCEYLGIEKAKKIRISKCKLPIVFISSISPQHIKSSLENLIIFTPSTAFISLREIREIKSDILKTTLKKTNALTDIQLEDVIHNYCNIKGIVGNIFHELKADRRVDFNELKVQEKNRQKEDENNLFQSLVHHYCNIKGLVGNNFHELKADTIFNEIKDKIKYSKEEEETIIGIIDNLIIIDGQIIDGLNQLKELVVEYQKANNRIEEIVQEIKSGKTSIEGFLDIKEEEITRFLPNEEGHIEKDIQDEKPWTILMLDDQQGELGNLKAVLKKRGISDIRTCETVKEAKEIIEKDKANKIVVVISDYRLFDKEDKIFNGKKLQSEQGYDFLVWLSKQNRHNKLIALSGLSRAFLQKSFRNKGIRVNVHSKNEINGNGANVFADEIEELGDEVNDILINIPRSTGWNRLAPYYYHHRNSDNYSCVEDFINEKSRAIVKQLKNILSLNDDELLQMPPIIALPNLNANLDIKTTNHRPDKENSFDIYTNKMIARRVAFWLHYCEGMQRNRIAAVLLNQNIEVIANHQNAGILFNHLGIALEDFPRNIIAEEKKWFNEFMGVNVYALEDVLTQIGTHCENVISDYFKNRPIPDSLTDYMQNNKLIICSKEEGRRCIREIFKSITEDNERKLFLNEIVKILDIIKQDNYCSIYWIDFKKLIDELE
jgi:hypothetical protein